MARSITYVRHIFATFTYKRDAPINEVWGKISKDFNRCVQKYRRLNNCSVQYLRTIEEHRDGYPHIHVLFQFPDARIIVENNRYFDSRLFALWKRLTWTHGLSDWQPPRHKGLFALTYILKYISKNSTTKTIWKKILPPPDTTSTHSQNPPTSADSVPTPKTTKSTSPNPIFFNNIKLCSWSRSFDFSPFSLRGVGGERPQDLSIYFT